MRHFLRTALLFSAVILSSSGQLAVAQNNNNGNNGGGVVIDALGVTSLMQERAMSPAALKKSIERFAKESLVREVSKPADERAVSLKHLSEQLQTALETGRNVPLHVEYMAGLTRINRIVFDQDRQDIYLVGPADSFGPDQFGRMVSLGDGRPVIRLDDFITALRSTGVRSGTIGCSIDPQPEHLTRLQQYLQTPVGPLRSSRMQERFQTMATILGPQKISIWGIAEDSLFAQSLVTADLRLKAIALQLEAPATPRIRSQLSLLKPQGNSLQRWWFAPKYDPLLTNAERTDFTLSGQRVQVFAQEEIPDVRGERRDAPVTRHSTQKFAQLFTDNYEELASRSATFSHLQNLYDLAVCSALIVREQDRLNLKEVSRKLIEDERIRLGVAQPPVTMNTVANFRLAGPNMYVGLVGGVIVDPRVVVRNEGADKTAVRRPISPFEGESLFQDLGAP